MRWHRNNGIRKRTKVSAVSLLHFAAPSVVIDYTFWSLMPMDWHAADHRYLELTFSHAKQIPIRLHNSQTSMGQLLCILWRKKNKLSLFCNLTIVLRLNAWSSRTFVPHPFGQDIFASPQLFLFPFSQPRVKSHTF